MRPGLLIRRGRCRRLRAAALDRFDDRADPQTIGWAVTEVRTLVAKHNGLAHHVAPSTEDRCSQPRLLSYSYWVDWHVQTIGAATPARGAGVVKDWRTSGVRARSGRRMTPCGEEGGHPHHGLPLARTRVSRPAGAPPVIELGWRSLVGGRALPKSLPRARTRRSGPSTLSTTVTWGTTPHAHTE